MLKEKFDRARIERAARIYASNKDAGIALGIAPGSFLRLCRKFDVETPKARHERRERELREVIHRCDTN
jgi:hypothetical protein